MNKTLVVDIGGTHVKLLMEGAEPRAFDSGAKMQPTDFVAKLKDGAGLARSSGGLSASTIA